MSIRYGIRTALLLLVAACWLPANAAAATIVVFGASGSIGGDIVDEALARGHAVIGVARNPARLTLEHPHFTAVQGDVTDVESFSQVVDGADGVIISVQGNDKGNEPENSTHAIAAKVAIEALTGKDNAPYVLQIGGATTIYETREAMAENLPFPAEPGTPLWGMFFGHLVALEAYRASDIAWTVLTPPALITGGRGDDNARTGKYRTSTDGLVVNDAGQSTLSQADLAVAAVDEIEKRQFVGRRFTVGY